MSKVLIVPIKRRQIPFVCNIYVKIKKLDGELSDDVFESDEEQVSESENSLTNTINHEITTNRSRSRCDYSNLSSKEFNVSTPIYQVNKNMYPKLECIKDIESKSTPANYLNKNSNNIFIGSLKQTKIIEKNNNEKSLEHRKCIINKNKNSILIEESYEKSISCNNEITHNSLGSSETNSNDESDITEEISTTSSSNNYHLRTKFNKKKYFYYYTNKKHLEKIKKNKIIRGVEGMFGYGVYGTSKPPQSNCTTIWNSLNDSGLSFDEENLSDILPTVECFVRISLKEFDLDNIVSPDDDRPEFFYHKGDISLKNIDFAIGHRKKHSAELNRSISKN